MRILFLLLIFLGALMGNSLPKFYTQTLENGLQIIAIPMQNGSNVITTDVFYKVGSRNEILGKSGIAHMLEHLNFKSTKNLKAGEFDEIVKKYGGITNASTGFDYTHYFVKSSSKNLDKSLELFSELMENLSLKDEEFQPERDVVAEERRWRTDNNPTGWLYFNLFNNAYVYHPYHWTPIGFMDDIKNWSIEDIRSFHSTYYQPKNAIVVVAGDIDKDTIFSLVKKRFKDIKNCCEIPTPHFVEPKLEGAKRVVLKKESDVEMLAIAYHIPNFEHEDQLFLSALSELLGSGKSSRLYKKLVDEKRMVNQVYAYNMELKDSGIFMVMAICNDGIKAESVEKIVLEEIEKIKTKSIKKEEIDKIKVNTKSDFIFSLESSSNVADLIGGYFARGNIEPLLSYEERISNLNEEDVKKVANRYLYEDNSITVILKK